MLDLPFVGRRAALDFLQEQLQLAAGQGSRLVLLSGLAGAGKTALVRRFLGQLGPGIRWVEGRGWDNQGATSYHPLRQALRQLPPQDALPANVQAFLEGPSETGDGPFRPEALFPALVRLLLPQVRVSPLCVFLDDLQWADEGTLEWLDFGLRELKAAALLWLGAYRAEDGTLLTSLLRHRPRWLRDGQMGEYRLEALTRAEVDELVGRVVPESQVDPALLERIWRRSEGLALFVVEEIRACREGGEGEASGRALIAERLGRLAAAEREVLELAAVIGERFGVSPLAATLGQDEHAVVRILESLRQDRGLLAVEETGYRFVHSRYREPLLEGMSPALRQVLHARLGEQCAGLPSAERTYHLVHSGNAKAAIESLLAESRKVLSTASWRDALRLSVEALWLAWDATAPPGLLAGSQHDLRCAVGEGRFRQDLYFRWRGMPLDLPPLRRQPEAIPFLVAHALARWSEERHMAPPRITRQAMQLLLGHRWPGNVRELFQEVERAAEEAGGQLIAARHLGIASAPATPTEEAARIRQALGETHGNVAAAARRLRISRTTLYRRMRRLGVRA
ncbi:MAG: AAA family ATPase [Candidatus Latescibacterota bacterium]